MFVLSEFKDFIRIQPSKFDLPMYDAIAEEVNRKLANKVVVNVGLVISMFDVLFIGDSHCLPGAGATFTEVRYRCIVFRPIIDEVITGKIKSCNTDGIHVTLGFFDDIFIPRDSLLRPSKFDEYNQFWIWEYVDDDQQFHQFVMEKGDDINFRVLSETFVDTTPSGPELGLEVQESEKKIPYSILGTIDDPSGGLGLPSWWRN